jgi:hypothetical protein
MGVPTLEFGYTSATTGRRDYEVHKGHVVALGGSNVQSVPASLQTFIDTPNCVLEDHVQYNTVHIPNVFCDGDLQIINCACFLYCNHQVHRDVLITLYKINDRGIFV